MVSYKVASYLFGSKESPAEVAKIFRQRFPDALVQTIDGKVTKNGKLVELMAAQTMAAADSGSLLARKREIDLILRLAGTTQISRGIELVGSRAGRGFVLVVARKGRAPSRLAFGRALHEKKMTAEEMRKVRDAALLSVERP